MVEVVFARVMRFLMISMGKEKNAWWAVSSPHGPGLPACPWFSSMTLTCFLMMMVVYSTSFDLDRLVKGDWEARSTRRPNRRSDGCYRLGRLSRSCLLWTAWDDWLDNTSDSTAFTSSRTRNKARHRIITWSIESVWFERRDWSFICFLLQQESKELWLPFVNRLFGRKNVRMMKKTRKALK